VNPSDYSPNGEPLVTASTAGFIVCILFHNLTNLDRSEQNAPRSFSPDCIDLVLI